MRALIVGIFVFVGASVVVAMNLRPLRQALEHQPTPTAPLISVEDTKPAIVPASHLPIELIGTIVRAGQAADGSIATIRVSQNPRENVQERSLIGALATVMRIERERVIFMNRATGKEESVRIRPYDSALAATPAAMSAPGDQKEFNLARANVDQQLQNLPQLLMSARATPATDRNGRIIGFRIDSMDDSSFFKQLGLQPGDLLTEVNGTKLESVEGVVKLFNELRGSSMIHLRATRQSRDYQLTYLIR